MLATPLEGIKAMFLFHSLYERTLLAFINIEIVILSSSSLMVESTFPVLQQPECLLLFYK